MRQLLHIVFLLVPLGALAQAPTFQWAETVTNVSTPGSSVSANDVKVATDGTAYLTGRSNGAHLFVGDTLVGSSFTAHYDTSGNRLWARSLGGDALALDANNAVYVVGTFSGNMQFGTSNLSASGQDAFVAKYAADGQALWARKMGGAWNDGGLCVAVDGLGRVHIGGYFRGTGTFGASTLIATHDSTGFLATYDTNGNFLWASLAGGFTAWNAQMRLLNMITCDMAGNTYMTGNFTGTATFGSTSLTTTDADRLYVARYDASGNCTWVYPMASSYWNTPGGIALTLAGDLYLHGTFCASTAQFNGVSATNSAGWGPAVCFVALLDADGNGQWVYTLADPSYGNKPGSLDVDAMGHAWVVGHAYAGGAIGTFSVTQGKFMAEFDPAGTVLSAQNILATQTSMHCAGAAGDHFFCGTMALGSNTFGFDGTDTVFISLGQASEAYLAHYHSDFSFHQMRRMGLHSMAPDAATGVITDAGGNVYSTGYFTNSAIICGDTLLAPLATNNVWLSKRAPDGACLWTTHLKATAPSLINQYNSGTSLAIAPNGDLLMAGVFFGTIDLGVTQLTSAGGKDLFIARFDAQGNCLWAVSGGGVGDDGASALSIASNGDLLVGGWYTGNATIADVALTGQGLTDGFIARFDPDGAGIWCTPFGGVQWDQCQGLAMDPDGNSYITGTFTGSASFGALTLIGSGDSDLFVAKFDANGALTWLTGSSGTGRKQGNAIVLGASQQLYVLGHYYGEQTICTSTLVGDPGNNHPYLACFGTNGELLWQHEYPCTLDAQSLCLTARPGGDLVMGGSFSGSLTLGANTLASTSSTDAWMASVSAAGDVLWAQAMGSTGILGYASVNMLSATANTVYAAGAFGDIYFDANNQAGGSITLAPGNATSNQFAPNSLDAFVAQFASTETNTPPLNPVGCDGTVSVQEARHMQPRSLIAPNPVDDYFTVTLDGIDPRATVRVRDMMGRELPLAHTFTSGRLIVDAQGLPPGAYTITLFMDGKLRHLPFIKE